MFNQELEVTGGIEIPDSPVRQAIERLIKQGHEAWYTHHNLAAANTSFDQIAEISRAAILERRNYSVDFNAIYTCVQHTFGPSNFNESSLDVRTEPVEKYLKRLKRAGFQEVQGKASPGDLIAYRGSSSLLYPPNLPMFMRPNVPEVNVFHHFGIYQGGGLVDSKFGSGHIFKHPYDEVSSDYGNSAFFFRRNNPTLHP